MLSYFFVFILLIEWNEGFKCRSSERTQDKLDMEEAVRQCIAQMADRTGPNSNPSNNRNDPFKQMWDNSGGIKEHRDKDRKYGMQGGGEPPYRWRPDRDTSDTFRRENDGRREPAKELTRYGRPNSSRRPGERDQNRPMFNQDDDEEEDDYDDVPDNRRPYDRPRDRNRPHSPGQQMLHDRDPTRNHRDRPLFQSNKNRGSENNNGDKNEEESSLARLDPLDNRGQLSKQLIMSKLTVRVGNRELQESLQYMVEDCLEEVEEQSSSYDNNQSDTGICTSAKSMAICLEQKGKEACEDWDEPMRGEEVTTTSATIKQDDKKPQNGTKKGLTLHSSTRG